MPWYEAIETAFASCTVFFLGAMVGSFLNVVAYRLPRGRSVVKGRSHCPACGCQIPACDNIPVFGWLLLRGRCRGCHAAIPARYPIVEAVCGGAFLLLFLVEIVGGGATIPFRPPDHRSRSWNLSDTSGDLMGLFLYHAATFCLLLSWGLIGLDRQRIPRRHAAVALGLAAVIAMVMPCLHPVPAAWPLFFSPTADWPPPLAEWFDRGLLVSMMGAAAGVLVGSGPPLGPDVSQAFQLAAVLVGIVFGWQGLLGTLLIAVGFRAADRAVARIAGDGGWISMETAFPAAVILFVMIWRKAVGG
jgi:leader peptidase (prepilin peptidase)/N-methyltransferase